MGYKIQQNQIEDLVVDLRDIRDSITGLEEELINLIEDTGNSIISIIESTGANLELYVNDLREEFEDFVLSGKAYDSDRLDGYDSSFYLNSANHTGTLPSGNLPNTSVTPGSYTSANVTVDQKGRITSISDGTAGIGDMTKVVYDTNNNGIVDNSETLNGESGSYYRNAANLTGTLGTGQLGSADTRYLKLDGGGDVSGLVSINGNGLDLYQDTGAYNGLSLNLYAGSLTGFPYSIGNINFVQFTGDDSILAIAVEGFSISNNESKLDFSISDTDGVLRKTFSINGDRTCEVYGDIIAERFIGNGHLLTGLDGDNITGKIQSGIIPNTSVTPGTYTLSTISVDSAGRITHAANGVGGAGDMEKSVYDTNDNGIVDNSERLGGELPAYYTNSNNLTGDINTGVLTGALENYIQFSGNVQNRIYDTFIFDQTQTFEQPPYFANGLTSSGTISSYAGIGVSESPIIGFLGPYDDPSYPTTVGQMDFFDGTPTGFITQNAQILVNAVDALKGQIVVKVSDTGGILQDALTINSDISSTFNGTVSSSGFIGDGSELYNIQGLLTTGEQYITGEKIFIDNLKIDKLSAKLTLNDSSDDTYTDFTRNETSCEITNGVIIPGSGLTFDGVNDYVDMGSSSLISTTSAFSISARVYLNSFVDPFPTIIALNSNIAGLWRIGFTNDASYQSIFFGHNSASWGRFKTSTFYTSSTITAKYIHVLLTYAGSNPTTSSSYKLYINGMESTLAAAGAFAAVSGNNLIGATTTPATDEKWNGTISDACIWDDVRTAAEALDEYINGVDETNPNLQHYWKMKEGSGTSISDSGGSGSPITGTISGATWGAGSSNSTTQASVVLSKNGGLAAEYGTQVFGNLVGNTILEGSRLHILNNSSYIAEIINGQMKFGNGSAALPVISSRSNYRSGFYFSPTTVAAAIDGVSRFELATGGTNIIGPSADSALTFKYSTTFGRTVLNAAFSSGSQNGNTFTIGINQIGGSPTTALMIIGDLTTTFYGELAMSSTGSFFLGTSTNISTRPALAFSNDVNTGLGHPSADTLVVVTAGSERIRVNSSGNSGFGTGGTISARLHVISTTEQIRTGYDASNYLSITTASNGGTTFSTTGSDSSIKLGSSTSQKLSLWNATPIIQPTTAIAAAAFVANTSLIFDDSATFGGYTIGQVVQALRNIGALA